MHCSADGRTSRKRALMVQRLVYNMCTLVAHNKCFVSMTKVQKSQRQPKQKTKSRQPTERNWWCVEDTPATYVRTCSCTETLPVITFYNTCFVTSSKTISSPSTTTLKLSARSASIRGGGASLPLLLRLKPPVALVLRSFSVCRVED